MNTVFILHSSYETLLIRQKCKQCILKWDAVGSILKQTKRKHQLTIKTCIKYVDKKSRYETKSPAKNLQISSCSIATLITCMQLQGTILCA